MAIEGNCQPARLPVNERLKRLCRMHFSQSRQSKGSINDAMAIHLWSYISRPEAGASGGHDCIDGIVRLHIDPASNNGLDSLDGIRHDGLLRHSECARWIHLERLA